MPLPKFSLPPLETPRSWLRHRLIDPLLELLKAGLAPGQLALTVGLGVAFGLAPTFGIMTFASAAFAWRLRLNVAAMQLVAHLMSVFQLALLIPFLRAGATILGHGHELAHFSLNRLRQLIAMQGWGAVGRLLWRAEIGALLIWAVASVPLVLALYFVLRAVFRKVLARQEEATEIAAGAAI